MKILVTGGAGFIGSHIVDAYIEAGHEVSIVDDLSSGKKENINEKAHFFKVDISNMSDLRKVFEKQSFDVVNHHAAQISVSRSIKDPCFDAHVNILGGLHLLELAVEFDVDTFIFASTGGAIYGDTNHVPTPEDFSPAPLSAYGTSKLSFEFYLKYYKQVKGLDYTVLRYSNVYGERQNPHGEAGVVAIFCEKINQGEQPLIFGDGEQTRDYLYIKDVVAANMHALANDPINTSVNIGTGVEVSVNQLFDMIVTASGKDVKKEHATGREGEQQRSALDATRAATILGWKPQYLFGSKKTLEVFKNIYTSFNNSSK